LSSILEFYSRHLLLFSWTEFFYRITIIIDFDINFINILSRTLDIKAQNIVRPITDTRFYFCYCSRFDIKYFFCQYQDSVNTVFLFTKFTELSADFNKFCFYTVRSASVGKSEYNKFYNIVLSVDTLSRLCYLL